VINSLPSLIFLLLFVKIWCNLLKRNSWVFRFHLFLNILFALCFKVIADAGPTRIYCLFSDLVVGGQREPSEAGDVSCLHRF